MQPRKLTPYEQHRNYVLAVLARRCSWLATDEREAVLHDAYVVMLEKQRRGVIDPDGMHPRQLRAFLTQTAINKALDQGKRAERNRTEPLEHALEQRDPDDPPEVLVEKRLDRERLRELLGELPSRRRVVVGLRFFGERTPEEIQRLLAISARSYRRDLERGVRGLGERYERSRAA